MSIIRETARGYVVAFALMGALSSAHAAGLPASGCGSSGNIIQGSGAQLDGVANQCIAGTNVTVSGTQSSNTAITMTPSTGQFVHIVAITVDNCAGASAVTAANPTTVTSSAGIGLTILVGSGVAAGLCQPQSPVILAPNVLRATSSGAQTVTTPTFATNQTVRVNVYWYSAP